MSDRTEVDGVAETEKVVSGLAWHLIRDTNRLMSDYAEDVTQRARSKAAQAGRLATMVAGSLSAKRSTGGDGGSVRVGGGKRLPSGSGSYSDVFFGAEWGGGAKPSTRQFQPWKPAGYWFYPAVREAHDSRLDDDSNKLQTKALKYWAS